MRNKIIHGDCQNIIPEIRNESIDLILTDIPYQISKPNNFKTMKDRRHRKGIDFGDWDHSFDINILKPLQAKLKPNGSLVIFHSIEQYHKIQEALTGLTVKDRLIFRKTNPMPRNRDRRYVVNIEFATWYTKGKKWTFNRQHPSYEECILSFNAESGGAFKRYHPTQKPLKLFKHLIKIHSNPGDIILDPFAGSCTTALAAIHTDRSYICIEQNKEYVNIAKDRIPVWLSQYPIKTESGNSPAKQLESLSLKIGTQHRQQQLNP